MLDASSHTELHCMGLRYPFLACITLYPEFLSCAERREEFVSAILCTLSDLADLDAVLQEVYDFCAQPIASQAAYC